MGEGEYIDLMMEHAPKSRVKVLQNIVVPFSAHVYQMDFTIGYKAANIIHIFVF